MTRVAEDALAWRTENALAYEAAYVSARARGVRQAQWCGEFFWVFLHPRPCTITTLNRDRNRRLSRRIAMLPAARARDRTG